MPGLLLPFTSPAPLWGTSEQHREPYQSKPKPRRVPLRARAVIRVSAHAELSIDRSLLTVAEAARRLGSEAQLVAIEDDELLLFSRQANLRRKT